MKKLALFMALVMAVSALPAIQVDARSRDDSQQQVRELPFDLYEQVQSQMEDFLLP